MPEQMKKFFVWLEAEGEASGKEVTLFVPKDVAECFVSERMPAIFDDEPIHVNVRDPEGVVHAFDVEVEVLIRASKRR